MINILNIIHFIFVFIKIKNCYEFKFEENQFFNKNLKTYTKRFKTKLKIFIKFHYFLYINNYHNIIYFYPFLFCFNKFIKIV